MILVFFRDFIISCWGPVVFVAAGNSRNSDKHPPFVEKRFLLATVDPDQWAAGHTVAIPVGDVVGDGWRWMMWSARNGLMDGPSDAFEVVRLPGNGRGARGEADREERKKRE